MELLNPIMYLVIAFALNAILFLSRRRLPWDWPMIFILAALVAGASYSIVQGEEGLLVGLLTLLVGFVIAEVGGRLGKRIQWDRIQGQYRKAYRKSILFLFLQPTAYHRVLSQMLKLVVDVVHRSKTYETAQDELKDLQDTVERIPNISIHMAIWESLYAFAAIKQDWPRLARNYSTELYPVYAHPPSGAGFYMVQALCEEGRYRKAGSIVREMHSGVQQTRMLPEESEVFYNKSRILWLAHMGYHREVEQLLHKDSALSLLFPKAQRKALLQRAQSTDKDQLLQQLHSETATPVEITDDEPHRVPNSTPTAESTPNDIDEQALKDADQPGQEDKPQPFIAEDIPALVQTCIDDLQIETYLAHDFVLWGTATRITLLVILVNVLIYVGVSLPESFQGVRHLLGALAWNTADTSLLWQYGACHPGVFAIGEGWRVLSGNFLHATIVHIGLNTYFLLIFGPLVERFLGTWRFINIYLLSGVAGFLAALWTGTDLVLVGASASIFGVFGASFVVLWLHRQQIPPSWFRRKMIIGVVLFVLNSYLGIAVQAVSFSAHMGGFVAGFLLASALLIWHQKASTIWRKAGVLVTLALWLPLLAWTGERVYTTSQQPLTTRLQRLQQIGPQSVPMLLTFRESSKDKSKVVNQQFKQMGAVARKRLFELLDQGRMQSMAAEVLGQDIWNPSDVTPPLYKRLHSAATDVQIYLLFALHWHKFQGLKPQQIKRVVRLILKHTRNRKVWVRKNATRLLYHLGPWAKAAIPILGDALRNHPSPKVRALLGRVLLKMGFSPPDPGDKHIHSPHRVPLYAKQARARLSWPVS